jgi:hypothetical protein
VTSVYLVNHKLIVYGDIYHHLSGSDMPTDHDWQRRVKGILKAELKRRHITYRDLAWKLREIGIEDTERNIANKIARGTFTAVFFVQCLDAIGCRSVQLDNA